METLREDQRDEIEALQAMYQPHEIEIEGLDETGQVYMDSADKRVIVACKVVAFEDQEIDPDKQRAAKLTTTWSESKSQSYIQSDN